MKRCSGCGVVKGPKQFHTGRARCKECRAADAHTRYENKAQEARLLGWARSRAKKRGIEFDLSIEDIKIPKKCPILGVPLVRPSLDRTNPEKGYVRGNVKVVSTRGNMLKSNGSLQEMQKVAAYLNRTRRAK